MAINWNIIVTGPGGLPIPTYGNYGGPMYSDGQVLTDPNQPVAYSSPPVDQLDALFQAHDQAYDSTDLIVRAAGDLALVQSIAALPDATTSAEQDLYGGAAVLFGLYQLSFVNDRPDLLTPQQDLALASEGVQMIGSGLQEASPQTHLALAEWAVAAAPAIEDLATGAAQSVEAVLASDSLAFAPTVLAMQTMLTSPDVNFSLTPQEILPTATVDLQTVEHAAVDALASTAVALAEHQTWLDPHLDLAGWHFA
jgi:hypothetical protein